MLLLTPYEASWARLKNHLVMAPMTRCRAIDNLPNELMAEYYSERSGAGLIITEGTSPAPEGLGYPRIPGIFSEAQVEGWKLTTARIKAGGSRCFVQLMHTGRIGHPDNLPAGFSPVAPSAIRATGRIYTDKSGMQDYVTPVALTTEGVEGVIESHVWAAVNAVKAGFDGVELHGANGYLIEQFLNPNTNIRTDAFGGSVQKRARLVLETAARIAEAIGAERVGVRFSPYNQFNDQRPYPEEEVDATYRYLAEEMQKLGIAYLHIIVTPELPLITLQAMRESFRGTIIQCNGLTAQSAETALQQGFADLTAFGKLFLANPDLDRRIAEGRPMNAPDMGTFYTAGAKGYTDYV